MKKARRHSSWSFVNIFLLTVGITATCSDGQAAEWARLLTIADSLHKAKQPDSAVAYGRAALDAAITEAGPEDTCTAYVYHRIGLYYTKFDTDSSQRYFQCARQIWESNPHSNPQNYARTLNNLGILLPNDGRYEEALECFQRALDLKRRVLPPYHPDIATTLLNMSIEYIHIGRYTEAEIYLQQASDTWDSAGVLDKSPCHLNGSALYRRQFRYEECIESATKAMKAFGERANFPAYHLAAENAAGAFLDLGLVNAADSIYAASLAYCETSPANPLPLGLREGRVYFRLNLARTQRLLGSYDRAQQLLLEAWDLSHTLASTRSRRAAILAEQGMLQYDLKHFSAAAAFFEDAIEHGQEILGAGSPLLVSAYLGCCQSRLALGQPNEALAAARHAVDISYATLPLLIAGVAENEALTYAREAERSLACYLECVRESPDVTPDVTTDAINLILRTKGITTDLLVERQRAATESQDPIMRRLREKRRFAAEQLSRSILNRPTESDPVAQGSRADSLRAAYRRASDELTLHDAAMRMLDEVPQVTAMEISRVLPEDALALEFYEVRPQGVADSLQYAVVVIDRLGANLKWLDSGPAIDSLVGRYRSHLSRIASQGHRPTRNDLSEYLDIATSLNRAILGPLESSLADKKTLFISPAGALGQVAFAGLSNIDGRYLVDSFEIHTLDAIRELKQAQPPRDFGHGLLAMGDPDFDARFDSLPTAQTPSHTFSPASQIMLRGGRSETLDSVIPSLPETRTEIEGLRKNLEGRSDQVEVYLAGEATEGTFKTRAKGHRYIHLATHGFNLNEGYRAADQRTGLGQPDAMRDPLLSCGLFFAGARQSIIRPDRVSGEDGVLYALEVAQLDLRGVELVTLSACESAVGTSRGSEGMYGLRRAFVLAGAQDVLASLWQVPDDATAALMSATYSRLGRPLPTALREAQLEVLDSLRKSGRVTHPFLWAAFVPYGI